MIITNKYRTKYINSSKEEKTEILNQYCYLSNIHRKSAIRKFSEKKSSCRKGKSSKYTTNTKLGIFEMWNMASNICSERIHPEIDTYIEILLKHKLISFLGDDEISLIREIPLGSLKRIIHTFPRSKHRRTNKNSINSIYKEVPIKVNFGKYNESGKIEVDFVEHSGGNGVGIFICTTTLADVFTGWTVNASSMGKDKVNLNEAFKIAVSRIYHKTTEYHPDNSKALLFNLLNLKGYGTQFKVSRARPYKSNDNAHVEQKNNERVRKWVGYARYDTEKEKTLLNELYSFLDDYQNFFLATYKLQERIYDDTGKLLKKVYDKAKTPYQRLLDDEKISPKVKQKLRNYYSTLDMITLKKNIDNKLKELHKVSTKKRRKSNEN